MSAGRKPDFSLRRAQFCPLAWMGTGHREGRVQRRRAAGVRPDYAPASRMGRSALIAHAVWVFTDPRLMPMTEAICASLISP
jgi:hypothetical protein